MTLVNFKFLKHTGKNIWDDPFVFASQAKNVFYVHDERSKDWSVALDAKVRDVYDMGDEDSNVVEEINEQPIHNTSETTQNVDALSAASVHEHDFFEVDVNNQIEEEEEDWENMF
jgi:hypothetical protein